ncbi:MAG: septal ring lytic transglycosylase RlpA family protein [Actinomycetes bacterium]
MAAVPFAALGLSVPGLGGGAGPDQTASTLPLRVNSRLIDYGSSVRVTGLTRLARGTKVVVSLGRTGGTGIVARAKADSHGRWSTTARLSESGRISAISAGSRSTASAAVSGPQVRVRTVISGIAAAPLKAGRTTLTAHVRPSRGSVWTVKLGRHGRWTQVKSGHSSRTGAIKTRLSARRGDRLRLTVSGGARLEPATARLSVRRFRPAGASWYGLYGDPVACGGVLHRNTVGVAHKTLPCGTKVTISYHGRTIVAKVIDRGPYIAGREFDLTGAAARALHFDGVGTIWVTP